VDNMTGVHYDMLANDSYTFQASTEDYESRFYISGKFTGVEENDGETAISNFAFFDGSQWVVNGKGRLELVDVTGRVLHAERLYGDQNTVSLGGFSSGLYLLRLTDGKNVMVQKIVIK
ncbi:MAG: T9SS type A sorting domain-containing protein, partial [Paludibacteraceae bacterium]|nr:T9SS type A sorting domain-containing protein [Paludibacteraceae bacterium]